jgi:hypothetical protein
MVGDNLQDLLRTSASNALYNPAYADVAEDLAHPFLQTSEYFAKVRFRDVTPDTRNAFGQAGNDLAYIELRKAKV